VTLGRREVVQLIAAIPLLRTKWEARASVSRSVGQSVGFFTPTELETVRLLSDLIVPRDERSGSATDAAVPEFLDFVLTEWPEHQTPIRGGLAWLDRESTRRFGKPFRENPEARHRELLDEIAYPARARPEMAPGVEFFNHFRDLVLSGFYSSKEGVKDLGYMGNTFVAEWKGCP
jgi:gluconate 2-dehydrogenase gamma chain